MNPYTAVQLLAARLHAGKAYEDRDSGDIPGWVMIAIMSAAVVVVLIPLVGSTISDAFTNAIQSVTDSGG